MSNDQHEPTMDEILSSIRRVISEDTGADPLDTDPPAAGLQGAGAPDYDPWPPAPAAFHDSGAPGLPLPEDAAAPQGFAEPPPEPAPLYGQSSPGGLLSRESEASAFTALEDLNTHLGGSTAGAAPLEKLVHDALRPMLRQWLDENLPDIVENLVEREITRITRRRGAS